MWVQACFDDHLLRLSRIDEAACHERNNKHGGGTNGNGHLATKVPTKVTKIWPPLIHSAHSTIDEGFVDIADVLFRANSRSTFMYLWKPLLPCKATPPNDTVSPSFF